MFLIAKSLHLWRQKYCDQTQSLQQSNDRVQPTPPGNSPRAAIQR